MHKICLYCGDTFYKKEDRSPCDFKRQKYCSRECVDKSKKGKHYSIKTEWKKNDVRLVGNKINEKRIPWNKNKKGIHLSPNSEFRAGNKVNLGRNRLDITGEKHFNWRGGKTKLREKIRKSKEYNAWHLSVFVRDKFTCQHCGRTKCWVEVHHDKISFAELVEKYKIKTVKDAINCPEFWDTNNGITLCRKCHRKTDNYFKGHKKP